MAMTAESLGIGRNGIQSPNAPVNGIKTPRPAKAIPSADQGRFAATKRKKPQGAAGEAKKKADVGDFADMGDKRALKGKKSPLPYPKP
jgi:hypothetical protein